MDTIQFITNGNTPNLIKVSMRNPQLTSYLTGKTNCFFPKIRNRMRVSTSIAFTRHFTGGSTRAIGRKIKYIHISKEEVKLSLLQGCGFVCRLSQRIHKNIRLNK